MNFDHKPHRGDKLQPLDEISGYKVRPGFYDRNGAAQAANGVSFTIHSMGATGCTLLLFRPKEQEPFAKIRYPETYCIGSTYSMPVSYTHLLASEVANAGEIILSHADEVSAEQADTTVAHLNRALEQIKCPRRVDKEVLRKSTLDLNEEDFNRLISCGYQMESYRKLDMEEKKGFESVYFMNVKMTEEQLKTTVGKLMNDRECGEVFRVKGFLQKEDRSWIQLNATHNGITMNPIEKGQEVIIVIGEELKEQAIKNYFLKDVYKRQLYDTAKTFYITELDMDSEEWDAYSIGDREDLDNDGEEELILCGPYGGKYLDARDGEVYEFAAGDGTAESLSYTYYQGYVWILYSNEMNSGYKVYHMERYDGADSKVNEMDFSEEYRDENDPEKGSIYVINSDEVSEETYNELCSRIFAAQMNTY